MKKPKDEWLTAGEVWHQFGFTKQALYNMRKAGQVVSRREGQYFEYLASSIEAYFMGRDDSKAKVPKPEVSRP